MGRFTALQAYETDDGFKQRIIERDFGDLPEHDVLIKVSYSSLNYKDALSANGHRGITRDYPHIPGIDAVGVVVSDDSGTFTPGTSVVVIGYDLGMNTSGGFSEYISVPKEWPIKLPEGMTMQESMMLGTAGVTAGYCVEKLMRNGLEEENGPILVTGASGGVGSIAVALLSQLGYEVVAVSGNKEAEPLLYELGASQILPREALSEAQKKPILRQQWGGAVDTVGGETLINILKGLKFGCSVAACGMVTGTQLSGDIFPYILRGVQLLGVASADASAADRERIMGKFNSLWRISNLSALVKERRLEQLPEEIENLIQGKGFKRVLVDLTKDKKQEGQKDK